MGKFDAGIATQYQIKKPGNGVYVFVLKGDFTVQNINLNQRDGLGIWDTDSLSLTANSEGAEVLLMEVPMQL